MSDNHEQKKKGGVAQDKQHKRMRDAERERHKNAAPEQPGHDRPDYIEYKRGSAEDRTPKSV